MEEYIEYDYSYIQTQCLESYGDVKAVAYINAYPMNTDGEQIAIGFTVAQVILSKHNDVIVAWSGTEGKCDPRVLRLVKKAKIEIQEYQ